MASSGPARMGRRDFTDVVTRAVLSFTRRERGRWSTLQRWGLPPAATLLVAVVQYSVFPSPSIAPFVFFYFAVALSAGLGGRGPGLLAVLLSALIANRLFMEPQWAWSVSRPALTATILFLAGGTLVALVCASFRASLLRLEVTARELERSGELLRLSHDAICVWAFDGGIEFWNRGAEQLYGFSAEEARGRVSRELLRTEFPRPWSEIQARLRDRHEWHGEVTHRTRDGRAVIVSTKLQLLRTAGGAERVLEANRDITHQKSAEQRLRAAYDLGIVGVLYWTVDGTITGANDRFLEMTGYTRDDLAAGRIDWVEMTPPEWRHLDEKALEDFRATGVSAPFEKEYIRKDGSRIPILVGGAMLDERRHEGVAFVIDISDRKRAEFTRDRLIQTLNEADQRKNEFLGMLSHELRNPLAPIRNSLYILGRAPPGGEQARHALAVIERQVQHMTHLVDDLLDVTRITRGKVRLQRERVELGELARRTAEDHREAFARNGIDLRADVATEPVVLNADPTRIAQVIGNLLQNAVKFTPRGGSVTLTVEQEAGAGIVTVSDTGTGIASEVLPRLFEPFVQADNTLDRTTGGLGLGLALVKGLAELHGGSVRAHSEGVGRGATFSVRLPLERRKTPRLTVVPAGPPPGAPRRVLVIEDNIDAAETLKEALEMNGHVVEIALTGLDGLEKARSFEPDVVLCDIGLPGVDGFQVARKIRADPKLTGTGLIALSGYAQPEDLERSRSAGFDLHLPKPPNVDALERAMVEVRESARARAAERGSTQVPGTS